jgi:UDP-N-acetylmuramate--alanine ligase
MFFLYPQCIIRYTLSMHIYFSGIGGTGIGPLSLVAKQAGYAVSGSDKQTSAYIDNLQKNGITDIHIGQTYDQIAALHLQNPIDWYVYSSAVAIEQPDAPELVFCREHGIKITKRDELLNHILQEKNLKLLAIAGTHGKTTTTAMLIWLFTKLSIPISYSVGAKLGFGPMGTYQEGSEYFIYEADEFDRNFLAFQPYQSLITGLDWDHPDIYPTRESYNEAFAQFITQSRQTIAWEKDLAQADLQKTDSVIVLTETIDILNKLTIPGIVNRLDAALVIRSVQELTETPEDTLVTLANEFPGLSRRFEQIAPGLYSDYAHTPPKIQGALQLAHEVAGDHVVVLYEGLHNTRQHFIKDDLLHLFDNVESLYIVPSYLAREDEKLELLTPEKLIHLLSPDTQQYTHAAELDHDLKTAIDQHLTDGKLVLALSAGGGGSLDEWLRQNFTS